MTQVLLTLPFVLLVGAPPPPPQPIAATASAAAAATDADVEAALRTLARDPSIADVQKAALEHYAVTPGDLSGFRAAARLRALLPALTGSYSQDDNNLLRLSTDRAQFAQAFDPSNPQITDSSSGIGRAFVASATWSLGSLVFDPGELEAYALVGIHEDVVKEVTRLYYARQHNLLALAIDPPSDARSKAALILRTREIEAMLDAMTGGAFSKMKSGRHAD